MNQASLALDQLQPGMPRSQRPGIVAGIAISLLLHSLLIFGYRWQIPVAPPPGPAPTPMTVWLVPATPPAPVVAQLAPPPKPEPKPSRHKKKTDEEVREARRAEPSPPAPATSPAIATPRAPQAITLPSQANQAPDPFHPEQGPKKFDMDAALKTARKVANEPDPARANLPVAQLDKKPLYPESHESQLSRDIANGKRPDCRTSAAGAGILAPLFWLADKKDSGCKW
jgi:hypothetical protein